MRRKGKWGDQEKEARKDKEGDENPLRIRHREELTGLDFDIR